MSLSIGQKAGWGLADMGIVVFVIVKQLLILAFMNSFLGIPIAIAGAVTTAVLVFDIISDPIIGYFSDKTVSRFGRRAPWMLIGSVVLALAMIGLFAVPESFNINASLIWVIIFFLISTLGFTMVSIPYGAMAGEMTLDKKERSSMAYGICFIRYFDWRRLDTNLSRRHKIRLHFRNYLHRATDYIIYMVFSIFYTKDSSHFGSIPTKFFIYFTTSFI